MLRRSNDLNLLVVNAPPIEKDVPFVTHAIDQVIHAIEIPQQSGFAAPRWSDEGGNLALRNLHVNVIEGLLVAVVKVEIASL